MVTPKAATPAAAATATTTTTVTSTKTTTGYVDATEYIQKQKMNIKHSSSSCWKDSSWLLCQRWISDGINLQRNGSVNYQEVLDIPLNNINSTTGGAGGTTTQQQQAQKTSSSSTTTTNTLRFKSTKILGSFPKQLSSVLVPLLQQNLIRIEAQALMEERNLNVGAHVALSLS